MPNHEENASTNKNRKNLLSKTGREFKNLRFIIDTMFLADALSTSKEYCIKAYSLDPFYCLSIPAYTYESCLYENKQLVEYITNQELFVLVKSGLRGGKSGVQGMRHF